MRPGDLSNALRCITWGVPRLIVNPYTDHYRIIQSPGSVVLDLETDLRIIPILFLLPLAQFRLQARG